MLPVRALVQAVIDALIENSSFRLHFQSHLRYQLGQKELTQLGISLNLRRAEASRVSDTRTKHSTENLDENTPQVHYIKFTWSSR